MEGASALLGVLRSITDELPGHEQRLNELDAALGDGDHGLTIVRCCRAIRQRLDPLSDASVADALAAVGMAVVADAGGASGALFGSAFMAAGRAVGDGLPVDAARVADMLDAARQAIASRGRVRPGDKTMLDALAPAALAARRAASSGGSVQDAVDAAAAAAEKGAVATGDMVGRAGRASRLGARSLGHPDPGAVSVAIMLQVAAGRLRAVGAP
jgi:phosphoenolpyruvate---glycerone phosphotransferase subunit DhaL